MKANPLYSIKTFGCKVNTYDSALIQKELNQTGFGQALPAEQEKPVGQAKPTGQAPSGGQPLPVHIINTCAVTEEAVKEALRYIRRYKKNHPQSRVVVTGCATQVDTKKFAHLKEVDLVVANSHKAELTNIITNKFIKKATSTHNLTPTNSKVLKSSIFKNPPLGVGGSLESGHTRWFLKIQDGCDSFCTFCVIPFARGKSRSFSIPNLVQSVKAHYDQGIREVVLTGVHIGDYQDPKDNQKGLAQLLTALLKQTKMPRIRLSSLEPIELTSELLDLFMDTRVCSHFHLSIQSVNSDILQKMKRKYKTKEVEQTLKDINKKLPRAFVGMDLITGFADESQAQFEDTYQRLSHLPWTKLHVFPYSPRQYTYAKKAYPSHPRFVIMKRASQLRHLSDSRFKQALKAQVGTTKKVLPLKHKEHIGLSRDYWNVFLPKKPHTNQDGEVCILIKTVDEQKNHLIACPKL